MKIVKNERMRLGETFEEFVRRGSAAQQAVDDIIATVIDDERDELDERPRDAAEPCRGRSRGPG